MRERYLLFFLLAGIFFTDACKKEYSFEGGIRATAVFTLNGAPGGCMGASVAGLYTVGTALTAGNKVTIQVDVTTAGFYTLATTALNGMIFTSSGIFTATGPQAIELTGSGTPVAAGNTNIPVHAGGSDCDFNVDVINSASASAFTVNCSSVVVNGVYAAGVPLGASNTASISVDVTATGTYSITTTTVNGITFSDSGIFTSTGIHTLTLKGSGIPLLSGTSAIPLTASCSFQVIVAAPSSPTLHSWIFVENGITYQGSIVSAHLTMVGSSSRLIANGQTVTGDTAVLFDLTDAAAIQVSDTYDTNNPGTGNKASFSFTDNTTGSTIYQAMAATPSVNLEFKIVSHDPLTKTIVGTFGGTALSGLNTIKTIHNGAFYITYP
ncbi:MAG: hypothetical protein Q8941_18330 [Bacteroidota bacterium]|nr:hypothetical protein [Bacteroidota bacterium]